MDQNFPMPAHSKFLRVLYQMWDAPAARTPNRRRQVANNERATP
jgi:hypothetical protein